MKTTMICVGVAILLGLASTALATEPLGPSTQRTAVRNPVFTAYAQVPAAQARHGTAQTLPFTADEKALFQRTGRPE